MIRIKNLLIVLLTFIFTFQLQSSEANSKFTVLESMGDASWIYDGIKVQDFQGEKSIIFVGAGAHIDRQTAKEIAQLYVGGTAAMAIAGLFSKQTEVVLKKINNTTITMERGVEVSFARNVDVSNLVRFAHFYRQVKVKNSPRIIYQWFTRGSLAYNIYKERRDAFLKDYANKNIEFRRKYTPIAKQLMQLDNASDGGISHIPLTDEEREKRENIGID